MTLSRWGGGSIQQAILRQEWQKVLTEGEEVAGARPLATGLVQAENGEVWIRSGLGLWGTREWCIVEPRSGRSTEIELPVSVEVLWVDGHRLIGVNQIPGQEGTLYFLRTRGGG